MKAEAKHARRIEEAARKLVDELSRARGHKRGVRARVLAERVGLSDRDLRDIVRRLILEKGMQIGTHPGFGIFMIVDREDRELATRHLRSRAIKILRRLAVLENLSVHSVAAQLVMFKEDGAKD